MFHVHVNIHYIAIMTSGLLHQVQVLNLTSPTLDAPSLNNCYEVTSCKLWVVQGWLQWLVWQWLKAAAVEAYLHTLQCYEHTRHYTYYWWRWHTWSSCWAAVCSKVGGWLPGWDCTSAHQPALHQQAARWARTWPAQGNIPQVHTSGYSVLPQYAG